MSPHTHTYLGKRLRLLATLLAVVLVLIVVATNTIHPSNAPAAPTHTLGEQIRTGILPPPPFATSTAQKLEQHHSFQALVSYTDRGFEPQTVTIHQGETVRFTNNSSGKLWVGATSSNGAIYPSDSSTFCGQSALDSCLPPVQPQDFWEVTLTKPGIWSYTNLVDQTTSGIVRVR